MQKTPKTLASTYYLLLCLMQIQIILQYLKSELSKYDYTICAIE
jgi:hypothetical protein